mmetsp:Transcript_54492/g.126864  ORF Transcript_54492/g.126864 Transcript_54492/m.126864 type:complete len:215 (-) Transcript_54492:46-690(-)
MGQVRARRPSPSSRSPPLPHSASAACLRSTTSASHCAIQHSFHGCRRIWRMCQEPREILLLDSNRTSRLLASVLPTPRISCARSAQETPDRKPALRRPTPWRLQSYACQHCMRRSKNSTESCSKRWIACGCTWKRHSAFSGTRRQCCCQARSFLAILQVSSACLSQLLPRCSRILGIGSASYLLQTICRAETRSRAQGAALAALRSPCSEEEGA